jgi:hypothetical protein
VGSIGASRSSGATTSSTANSTPLVAARDSGLKITSGAENAAIVAILARIQLKSTARRRSLVIKPQLTRRSAKFAPEAPHSSMSSWMSSRVIPGSSARIVANEPGMSETCAHATLP